MDFLLIAPPVANFGQASSGLSVLTAYLRSQGWDAHQWDLAIEAFHHFHSPEFIGGCLEVLEHHGDERLINVAKRVVAEIDGAKDALRRPGIERDTDAMRWAFETIGDAGIVMTAVAGGRYEHDFRHFGVNDAFRSFETLDAARCCARRRDGGDDDAVCCGGGAAKRLLRISLRCAVRR